MKTTITKDEILAIPGVSGLSEWKDRQYINFTGACVSKAWLGKDGKVRFSIGKGRNSTEANEAIEILLGCEITSRYSKKPAHIILD